MVYNFITKNIWGIYWDYNGGLMEVDQITANETSLGHGDCSLPGLISGGYPLVNIQKAMEHGPVEIVDFPIKHGGCFHGKMLVHQRVHWRYWRETRPLEFLGRISGRPLLANREKPCHEE